MSSTGCNAGPPVHLRRQECMIDCKGKSTCAGEAACSRGRRWRGQCAHSLAESERKAPTDWKKLTDEVRYEEEDILLLLDI